jgi:hypothetical protein
MENSEQIHSKLKKRFDEIWGESYESSVVLIAQKELNGSITGSPEIVNIINDALVRQGKIYTTLMEHHTDTLITLISEFIAGEIK